MDKFTLSNKIITAEHVPDFRSISNSNVKLLHKNPESFYLSSVQTQQSNREHVEFMNSTYHYECHYVNNTNRDITVMTRDGLAVTIEPTPNIDNPNFIIRKTIKLRNKSLSSAVACLSTINNDDCTDLENIRDSLSTIEVSKYSDFKMSYDYVVDISELQNNESKSIYHYQTDLVISLLDSVHARPHPFSEKFINIGAFGITNKYDYTLSKDFHLKIRYLNNSSIGSSKFIKIFGSVVELKPQINFPGNTVIISGADGKKKKIVSSDYIEVFTTSKNTPGSTTKFGVTSKKYTLEQAREQLGVYDTYKEALNSGDEDFERKQELAKADQELALAKIEAQKVKAKADIEGDSRKAEIANQQFEIDKTKLEAQRLTIELTNSKLAHEQTQQELNAKLAELNNTKMLLDLKHKSQDSEIERSEKEFASRLSLQKAQMQDTLDTKAAIRKDSMDFLKVIPALIIGISGIIAVYAKYSNNSK